VEQGKAPVFYKGERVFKLCCTSKLRDEGITFSEILNPDSALEKNRYFHCQISNA
jgi:hypothetical protein